MFRVPTWGAPGLFVIETFILDFLTETVWKIEKTNYELFCYLVILDLFWLCFSHPNHTFLMSLHTGAHLGVK